MTKFIALAVTLTAFAIGTTFAGTCSGGGGSCGDKKADKKKDGTKESAAHVIQF